MSDLNRRRFLSQLGVGVAAAALTPGRALAAAEGSAPTKPRPLHLLKGGAPDWKAIKRSFGLNRRHIHMAGFFLASHPEPVKAAIEAHRAGLDANPYDYVEKNGVTLECASKDAAAAYLGVHSEQIALTDSTTMGLGLLYGGIDIGPGQEVVSTIHDHWATQRALLHRTRRYGSKLHQVKLYDPAAPLVQDEEALLAPLFSAMNSKTRVVAVTWVHSTTGVKLPIRTIADRVAVLNKDRSPSERILLCVDGVHAFGVENFNFADLGCDFLVAGCHKWLFGPRGTGLVCGREDAWPFVTPTISTFSNYSDSPTPGQAHTPGGFHSFEHRWALKEAFEFHSTIGKANVTARIRELNAATKQGLSRIPGVRLLTPMEPEHSAGIVVFEVPKVPDKELLQKFEKAGVFVAFNYAKVPGVRVAPGLLNDLSEVQRTLDLIRSWA